ncbi:hypothetical protein H920_07765 [Fukomys damarensis]|uniref:Uncharacterized protein n=1 Tax=Fukomys damarensis TaxID=885580 RepID=A0A091DIH1_FUKDA|nr:hypothetical protein H920_07765 [Fukomys damarensis]
MHGKLATALGLHRRRPVSNNQLHGELTSTRPSREQASEQQPVAWRAHQCPEPSSEQTGEEHPAKQVPLQCSPYPHTQKAPGCASNYINTEEAQVVIKAILLSSRI